MTADFVPTDAVNYTSLSVATAGNFIIAKATPTLSVTLGTYTYNGSPQGPGVTETNTGGSTSTPSFIYVGTGSTTYPSSSTKPTNAGSYQVTASVVSDANYLAASSSATSFTISKVTLTIIADNKTKTQGDPNPSFTFTYSGFVAGENPSSLTTIPSATCSANNSSAVGSYPIIPAGGVAANYTFVYQNGILTITAPLIMKFEIPNAFIPNDIYADNRFLKASYNASVQKVISFMVFNRMGTVVYEKQNVDPGEIRWDGRYKDVLQESDVYYWVAKISGLGTPSLSDTRGQFLLLK
jgi:hypothetical protein